MKRCCICLRKLDYSEFYKSGLIKDGYRNNCKSCYLKEVQSYHMSNKGKEARKLANKKYYHKNKIVKETYSEEGLLTGNPPDSIYEEDLKYIEIEENETVVKEQESPL